MKQWLICVLAISLLLVGIGCAKVKTETETNVSVVTSQTGSDFRKQESVESKSSQPSKIEEPLVVKRASSKVSQESSAPKESTSIENTSSQSKKQQADQKPQSDLQEPDTQGTRKLIWRQPSENNRVKVFNEQKEFVVEICNTYQQFQDVLQMESLPYSAEYFETGSLMVVTLSTPHTGYSHFLKDLYVANDTLYMEWDLKCLDGGVAAHRVDTWYYFVEVNQPITQVNGAVAQITQYADEEHILKVYQQTADII